MKYKIALFGVKSDTHFIYNNLGHEIDLGITLSDKEKSNYHISGEASLKNSYINCFFNEGPKNVDILIIRILISKFLL